MAKYIKLNEFCNKYKIPAAEILDKYYDYYKIIGKETIVSTELVDFIKSGEGKQESTALPLEEIVLEQERQEQEISAPDKSTDNNIDTSAPAAVEIEELKNRIKELEKTITEKDKQIADYAYKFAELATQAQQLAGQAQYLHLSEKTGDSLKEQINTATTVEDKENKDLIIDKPKKKQSFWKWLFG